MGAVGRVKGAGALPRGGSGPEESRGTPERPRYPFRAPSNTSMQCGRRRGADPRLRPTREKGVPAGTKTVRATWVGEEIGKRAKAVGVAKVVFDRGGRKYHGRVRAVAEGARKAGLEL